VGTASLRPLIIMPQIFTARCTKLRKHFAKKTLQLLKCFTVSLLRSACLAMHRIDMFCRPRESMESILPGSSWKALWVLWYKVLTDASCWPSSNCILAQKIVSVSTEVNHNRSALDSGNGVCCHHSSVYIRALYTTARVPNSTCEAIPPGRNAFCQQWKNNLFTKNLLIW